MLEQSTLKTSRTESLLGLLFALSGALIATSLINVGDSGIPFFFITFLLPPLALAFPSAQILHPRLKTTKAIILLSLIITFLLLYISAFCRLLLNVQEASSEIIHLIGRVSFLIYFAICLYFLEGNIFLACLVWLRRILIILALYGTYQLPAKLLGLPLFLDWLRNNRSYAMYDYDTAGWISLVRANSIFPEPSLAAVPILVLLLLNKCIRAPLYSTLLGWAAVTSFSIFTFSRTVWLSIIALLIGGAIGSNAVCLKIYKKHKISIVIILLIAIFLMPLWAFVDSNYRSDLSRQERAGSIVMGIQLIRLHPLIGSGWNSYQLLMPQFPVLVKDVSPEIDFKTIHNMFISYVEQSGVPGLIFALFPFIVLIAVNSPRFGLTIASLLALLSAAELGGDVGYSSLFWLWIAILLNWNISSGSISASQIMN